VAFESVNLDSSIIKLQHAKRAGLSEAILYMREEAKRLMKFLNDNKVCNIEGSPGTGKSSLVWAWACSMAREEKTLWLHYNKFGNIDIATLNGFEIKFQRGYNCSITALVKEIKDLDIIIADGVRKDHKELLGPLLNWLYFNDQKRLVLVSSLELALSSEDLDHSEFLMESWTIEEYREACKQQELLESVMTNLLKDEDDASPLLNDLISRKFYWAGSNARWFFGTNIQKSIEDINKQIRKVGDPLNILSGQSGSSSFAVVNHLGSSFKNKIITKGIVSEYVAVSLTLQCELKVVRTFLNNADVKRNPSMLGWITELKFLATLRYASKTFQKSLTVVGTVTNENEEWTVQGYQEGFDALTVQEKPVEEWIIPKKWNQGGYDFIQYKGNEGLLRVVQVTRAQSHPYKMEFVCVLLKALRNLECVINKLDVVMILESANSDNFNPGSVTGYNQLRAEKDMRTGCSWKKEHIRCFVVVDDENS
jgi:hypothetical protein